MSIRFAVLVETEVSILAGQVLVFVKGASCGDCNFSKTHHAPESTKGHGPNTCIKQFINIKGGL